MPQIQITGGAFQDFEGGRLANGYLTMALSHDEQEPSGPSQVAGAIVRTIPLDEEGNISGTVAIWPNDVLSPASSYYIVNAYKADGVRAWHAPQYYTIASSPNPLNLGNVVPTNPPPVTSTYFPGLTLQTNSVNNGSQTKLNLINGANITITDGGTGGVTIGAGGGSSSLAGDSDVSISSPADCDLLTYNASASKWKNKQLTAGTNVTITETSGAITIAASGGGSSTLAGDSDVSISSSSNGQALIYNGSAWVNRVLASGDIPNNAANTTGSSGSCTGNAATATTAANLSGTPTLPNGTQAFTQTAGDTSNDIATDAFVASALSAYAPPVPSSLFTRTYYTSTTRALGTVYRNTTGQPLVVIGCVILSVTNALTAYVSSNSTPSTANSGSGGYSPIVNEQVGVSGEQASFMFVVPNNYYYEVVATSATWQNWMEFKINSGSVTFSGDLGSSGASTRALSGVYQNTGTNAILVAVDFAGTTGNSAVTGYSDPSPSLSPVNYAITSCTTNSGTSATLAVANTTGFTVGALVFVAGLSAANNVQLNGAWVIASISAGVSITITGSGWTAHTATGDTGTITQSNVVWLSDVMNIAFKGMVWMIVPGGHYYELSGGAAVTVSHWNEYTLPFKATRSSNYAGTLQRAWGTSTTTVGGLTTAICPMYQNTNGADLFVTVSFGQTSGGGTQISGYAGPATLALSTCLQMLTATANTSYIAQVGMIALPTEFYGVYVPTGGQVEEHWWEYTLG